MVPFEALLWAIGTLGAIAVGIAVIAMPLRLVVYGVLWLWARVRGRHAHFDRDVWW